MGEITKTNCWIRNSSQKAIVLQETRSLKSRKEIIVKNLREETTKIVTERRVREVNKLRKI